ncbi:MAG: succinate dehydrogenase, cytochrome b556 subunit [Pseudomonadota bacterium]
MSHKRPLSPHLQIYKPQLTSVLSIMHRLTGVFLSAGAVVFALWILSLAQGPEYFKCMQWFTYHFIGRTFLLAWTFAFFYHLCNGIRHLFWDAGYGYELPQVYKSGWAVVLSSFALTFATWSFGYFIRGEVTI